MLADDVRVEPVGLTRMNGRSAVTKYFQYSLVQDRHLVLGFVDRHPAASGARSERYGNVEFDIAGIPPAAEAGLLGVLNARMGYVKYRDDEYVYERQRREYHVLLRLVLRRG